jgi:hypothetical protein
MDFKEDIKALIKKTRNVRDTSINAYVSNLSKLLKLADKDININNLNSLLSKPSDVIELLEDRKHSTIRNYLASIVVIVSAQNKDKLTEEYRKLMDEYSQEYSNHIKTESKSDKQNKNWVSLSELEKVLKTYKNEIDRNKILKKTELSKKDMDLLQKYVVGNLYIGDESNPPLRNDYIMEIITEPDYKRLSEADMKKNYLVVKNNTHKYFSIGEYKTSGKYGVKQFPIGKSLNRVLNMWLKFNKTKYLLLNSKNGQMTSNGLTKYIQKVFSPTGKKIGASMLRTIYITEKLGKYKKESEKLSDKMLHSVAVQQDVYNKN